MKILFADLDGTLIKTISGSTFPKDENDWELKLEVCDAIRRYAPDKLHIVSNQGGIAAGYTTICKMHAKMRAIIAELAKYIICPITYEFCGSMSPTDINRKPNPGMLLKFIKLNDISKQDDLLMIGDASGLPDHFSDSDVKCAAALSKYGYNCMYMDVEDFVCNIAYDQQHKYRKSLHDSSYV